MQGGIDSPFVPYKTKLPSFKKKKNVPTGALAARIQALEREAAAASLQAAVAATEAASACDVLEGRVAEAALFLS